MVHSSEKGLESLDISSLRFAVAPDGVQVYIDETGLYFFGCGRQSHNRSVRWASHRQRTHIEDVARTSGRRAVTRWAFRCLRHPFSSEHGRNGSKGSDASPLPATHFM